MTTLLRISFLFSIGLLLLLTKSAHAVSFYDLGQFSGGSGENFPTDISADGSVVVGQRDSFLGKEAYRWSAETGMVGLGFGSPTVTSSIARAVSADGSVITGDQVGHSLTAFTWTAKDGFEDIAGFGGPTSTAAISANGQVVVGASNYPIVPCPDGTLYCNVEGFRWSYNEGITGVGDLDVSNIVSLSTGVSADGSIVVGLATNSNGEDEAFRWTSQTGIQGLGDLPGGMSESFARAISADGKVIVGVANSDAGREGFRWTAEGGMVGLGDFQGGGHRSEAVDLSADGSVIVGNATTFTGQVPFIWDQENGMRLISDVLTSAGIELEGWTLTRAAAISANGKVIVGSGWSPNGHTGTWMIELDSTTGDANYDNEVDNLDLSILLSQFGQTNTHGSLTADFDGDGNVALADLLMLKKSISSIATLEGDANLDNVVDQEDLSMLLSQYGQLSDQEALSADFDNNGIVSLADLLILKRNISADGEQIGNAIAAVPEPTCMISLLLSLICFALYYRLSR